MFSPSIIKQIPSFSQEFGSLENFEKTEVELCSDSRKYQRGQLFWAIKGPHFDGFKFAEQVIKNGCELIVFEASQENLKLAHSLSKQHDICLLAVKDSVKALQETAVSRLKEWRGQNQKKLVMGITGSNGKTTHKEMLWGILNQVFPDKVYCTEGNLNNHLGVPFTLLALKNNHEIAIVEMGTNHPGEIPFLCEMAEPDTGLITNIGESHLEFFKTKENVFLEKRALFDKVAARNKGPFVLNQEDPFLKTLNNYPKTHFFSDQNEKAHTCYQLTGETLHFSFNGQDIEITNKNLFGDYNFKNLLSCFLLAALNFPEKVNQLAEAASSLVLPSNNRCTFIEKKGKEIFLDAYNANPSSMKVALEAYSKRMKDKGQNKEETFFIVGDMNELGDLADESHQQLGTWLKNMGHPKVIFIGRYGEFFKKTHDTSLVFKDVDEFKNNLPDSFNDARFLFIKASRSLQLETIIDIV